MNITCKSSSSNETFTFVGNCNCCDKQDSYRSWKTWKVLKFYYGIFQDWKVLEKGNWSWKVLEIC